MVTFTWAYIIAEAVSAVGIIEWVKQFPGWKLSLIWWALVPVVSFGVAFAADGGIWQILSNGCLIWSISQLGYGILVKLPETVIKAFQDKLTAGQGG